MPAARNGFPPVVGPRAKLLILGSFPSEASLAAGHYYAHPRNQFWPILGEVLGEPLAGLAFEERYRLLRARGIALWDVHSACRRQGSLDSAIRDPLPNDFSRLRELAPGLERVVFNGRHAARFAPALREQGYQVSVLPSTSPAYAAMSLTDKLAAWREALAPIAGRAGSLGVQRPEPPITLSEENGMRYLHFGSEWVQGAMWIRRPWDIAIDYVAQMMAWLLFLDPPERILQLGLGAGALTRWCWRRLPDTGIDVVEASAGVIRVARSHFALPADDERLTVHHGDAADFVAEAAAAAVSGASRSSGRRRRRWAVIQADLYDAQARGPVCDSLAFYRDCRSALDPAGGMLVVNLFGEHASWRKNIARIRRTFDGRVLEMPPVRAGNRVVMAFTGPPLEVAAGSLSARAAAIERRWRLPAVAWARALLDGAGHRSSGDREQAIRGLLV